MATRSPGLIALMKVSRKQASTQKLAVSTRAMIGLFATA
jgi:hypothetical protein